MSKQIRIEHCAIVRMRLTGRGLTRRVSSIFVIGAVSAVVLAFGAARAETIQLPAEPVAPTSERQCSLLYDEYTLTYRLIHDRHEQCLQLHQGEERGAECSALSCEGLHAARKHVQVKRGDAVERCRESVARHNAAVFEAKQEVARQEREARRIRVTEPATSADSAVQSGPSFTDVAKETATDLGGAAADEAGYAALSKLDSRLSSLLKGAQLYEAFVAPTIGHLSGSAPLDPYERLLLGANAGVEAGAPTRSLGWLQANLVATAIKQIIAINKQAVSDLGAELRRVDEASAQFVDLAKSMARNRSTINAAARALTGGHEDAPEGELAAELRTAIDAVERMYLARASEFEQAAARSAARRAEEDNRRQALLQQERNEEEERQRADEAERNAVIGAQKRSRERAEFEELQRLRSEQIKREAEEEAAAFENRRHRGSQTYVDPLGAILKEMTRGLLQDRSGHGGGREDDCVDGPTWSCVTQ